MRTKSVAKKNSPPGIICSAPWRLTKVKPLANYRLEVEFTDGTSGRVEMSKRILSDRAGVFAKLKDENIFNQVCLEYGAVSWLDEIDLAPDAMHEAIQRSGLWILE